MTTTQTPLSAIKGVGEKKAALLRSMGIYSVEEMLLHLPKSYLYRGNLKEISLCQLGEKVLTRATLTHAPKLTFLRGKGKAALIRARFGQESGEFEAHIYALPVMKNALKEGSCYLLFGTLKEEKGKTVLQVQSFEKEKDTENYLAPGLCPVYPLPKETFSQREFTLLMHRALEKASPQESIPLWVLKKEGITPLNEAIPLLHRPSCREDYQKGHERLLFERFLHRAILLQHRADKNQKAPFTYSATPQNKTNFLSALPFAPTGDQKKAMERLEDYFALGKSANVLLQGDVGCGKSVVAYWGMYLALQAGMQSVYVMPTRILCAQQGEKLTALGKTLGFDVCVLSAEESPAAVKEKLALIASGKAKIIVATHSAFSEKTVFKNLGFVVCDEQHRFGVSQRGALAHKGLCPHMLTMSATPIPRTLSLALYGDVDVINILEKPAGKRPILTRVRRRADLDKIFAFLQHELQAGHGVYMVAPSIDSPGMASVEMLSELARERLPGVPYATITSMTPRPQREKAMEDFAAGKLPLLLCTTVIEVGVDSPLATVIVIFDAGRFGLSTLHQLRGRVGRNDLKAYCILIDDTLAPAAKERLKILEESDDGFIIAQKDLALRGAGRREGTEQSGHGDYFEEASPENIELFFKAHNAAKALLERFDEGSLAYIETTLKTLKPNEHFIYN